MAEVVQLPGVSPPDPQAALIAEAEALLDLIRSGEVNAFVGVARWHGGNYRSVRGGNLSTVEALGLMHLAMHDIATENADAN